MNFYRSVIDVGGEDYSPSYTITAIKADGSQEVLKGSCYNMFRSVNNSSTCVIGNNVVDCRQAFYFQQEFNQNITIPSGVKYCSSMFESCWNLNQNILMPDSVENCSYMFSGCNNLNQNIKISNNATNLLGMFEGCYKLNQSIKIPSNVKNCRLLFANCNSFNKSITIPNGVTDVGDMFYRCTNFNQDVTIPSSAFSCSYMMANCSNFARNVYINTNGRLIMPNLGSLLKNTSYRRINVFCKNLNYITDYSSTSSTCIMGYAISSWTQQTNGYYNASYNIYLYNNYNG